MRPESNNDPQDGPIGPSAAAVARAARALGSAPAGLLTDFDGTLAPMVADPAAARPVPGATAILDRLAADLAVVAVITGRAAADARDLLGTDAVLVVGNHGLEWLEPGSSSAVGPPNAAELSAAVAAAASRVPPLTGIVVERKGLSATIHVRGAADPAKAMADAEASVRGGDLGGLELRRGRLSLEIRPVSAGNKGTATRAIVERYALRGLLVLGDDVTDLDMFRAAAELRSTGTLEAAILAVHGGREVPARVVAAADEVLGSPAEVVQLLEGLTT